MKNVSIFALSLALTLFVACKGKESGENGEMDGADSISTSVETGASETLTEAQKTEEVLNQSSDDELFGTDVDDAEVENATKSN
jgi:hypothetical protein